MTDEILVICHTESLAMGRSPAQSVTTNIYQIHTPYIIMGHIQNGVLILVGQKIYTEYNLRDRLEREAGRNICNLQYRMPCDGPITSTKCHNKYIPHSYSVS
jgi:hypothetical protein